jgi:hypothetical protein
MNILFHFVINSIIGFILQFNLTEILFIGLGGILIDIDHLFYWFIIRKESSLEKWWKFHKNNFKSLTPHLYFFHFIEIIILFMIISYQINWYLFLISFGFLLHYIFDFINHLVKRKQLIIILKFFSLIIFLVSYKKKK